VDWQRLDVRNLNRLVLKAGDLDGLVLHGWDLNGLVLNGGAFMGLCSKRGMSRGICLSTGVLPGMLFRRRPLMVVLDDAAASALPTRADAAAALVAEKGVVWVKVWALGRMPEALADAVAAFSARG
jgi:hypothetical protein